MGGRYGAQGGWIARPSREVGLKAGCGLSLDELVALLAARPVDFAPGSRSAYSNSGYALLWNGDYPCRKIQP